MKTWPLIAVGIALLVAVTAAARILQPAPRRDRTEQAVQALVIGYRTHAGRTSHAVVLLPGWYGPSKNPPLALVISPHGRGLAGETNARLWGNLPAVGGFAVVNPDGAGEHLSGRFSWGAPCEIEDLARMPQIVRRALPWVRLDRSRIYAVGGSMGGQETLLLLAKHPRLLAGAVAVDPAVDFARRYRDFPADTRRLARREVGGTPQTVPQRFAERNPLTWAATIATSGVPLQIWWSRTDRIIVHSELHSGLLVRRIRELNQAAPLTVHTGTWRHTHPLRWDRRLPEMVAALGLLDS